MGKNGKKAKSERINAIRKQYDAFLEEDRKRKDRNEFILERLDKMRSCTAVVPLRHTQTTKVFAHLNIDKTNPYICRTFSHEQARSTLNQVYNSNVLTTTNEEALVKELSKKYILIPKHQRALDFEYNYPTKSKVEDVNDWRSKYSILEELKKDEKEEGNRFVSNKETLSNTIEFGDHNEVNINDKADNPEFIIKVNDNLQKTSNLQQPVLNTDTKNTENKQELFDSTNVSKHIPISEIHSEFNENNSNIEGNHQPSDDLTEKEKLQAKYELECKPQSEENCVKEIQNNQYLNAKIRCQEEHREAELLSMSDINVQDEINELPIQNYINPEKDKNDDVSQVIYQDDIYTSKIEQSQKSELDFDNTTIEPEILNNPDAYQAQSNEDDVQELMKEVNEGTTAVDNEEIQQEIIENVSQQVVPVQQYEEHQTNSQEEYENTIDEPIQDFEAEQNNMFYSDQTGDYTYGETGTADNTTVEYANNEGYQHNENYAYYEETPQNQDYSTDYEATPQNQAYNNEVNEHEESTEQYDPNYQNQYENYGQEEPPPETVQEYTVEEYATQQNFDQAIYEESNYNAAEEVQQHLDDEEAYTKTLEEGKGDLDDIAPKEELPENPIVEQEVKVKS